MKNESIYWDKVFTKLKSRVDSDNYAIYWNRYFESHRELINNSIGSFNGFILKTDAFDEAMYKNKSFIDCLQRKKLVLIDISKNILKNARKNHKCYLYVLADVSRIPFKNNSFDAIVSVSTLDNLKNMKSVLRALKELCRILKNNGIFLVTLDSPYNPIYRFEHEAIWRILPIYRSFLFISVSSIMHALKKFCKGIDVISVGSLLVLIPLIDKIIMTMGNIIGSRFSAFMISKITDVYEYITKKILGCKICSGRFLYLLVRLNK